MERTFEVTSNYNAQLGRAMTREQHAVTASQVMIGLKKLHLNDEANYNRYVEQKFMEALTNTLGLMETIRTTDDNLRIAEVSEGLWSNYLNQILNDIDAWKKESEGGSNVISS